MKNSIRMLFVLLSLIIIEEIISNSNGPGGGYSGAPSENNCTNCHGSFSLQTSGVNFNRIKLDIPFTSGGYIPDSTYLIKISYRESGKSVFGFQITALDAKNNEAAGTFTANDTRTQTGNYTISGKTRYYAEHTSSGTSAVTTDSVAWLVKWKAPNKNVGTVRFHLNLNVTNANGSTSGDYIYKKSFDASPSSLLPKATASIKDSIICSGKSIQFAGSGTQSPTSYQWSFPGASTTSSNQQNPQITYASTGNYLAILTVKNNKGTSAPDTLRFRVLQGATKPTINISGVTNLCNGDSLRLNANNITGHSLTWMPSNNKKNNVFVKDSGTYFAVSTNSVGCTRNSDNVIVKLIPKPAGEILIADKQTDYCINSTVAYSVKKGNPWVDSFSFVGISGGYKADSSNTIQLTTVGSRTVSAWVKSSNGCVSAVPTVSINVIDSLNGPEITINDTQLTQLRFTWNHNLGNTYSFSLDGGKVWKNPEAADTANFQIVNTPTANYTVNFWLKSISNHACKESKMSMLNANTLSCKPLDYSVIILPISASCADSIVQLKLNTNLTDYRWSVNSDTVINQNSISQKLTKGKNEFLIGLMNLNESICGFTQKNLGWMADSLPVITFENDLYSQRFCRPNNSDTIQIPIGMKITGAWKNARIQNNIFQQDLTFPDNQIRFVFNKINPQATITVETDSGCIYTNTTDSMDINSLPSANFKVINLGGYSYSFIPDEINLNKYSWLIGDSLSELQTPEFSLYEYRGNRIKAQLTVMEKGNGCINTQSDSVLIALTKINQTPTIVSNILPNPVNKGESLIIKNSNPLSAETIKIELFNAAGKLVYHQDHGLNTTDIPVETDNFTPGLYLLKLSYVNGLNHQINSTNHKIIINESR